MNPEKFAWLESVTETSNTLEIASGAGYVTMAADPQAYATVRELIRHNTPGFLISATALMALRVGGEVRYPLMLRDVSAAISPNRWQFPGGRCAPDEQPVYAACRELTEELGISGAVADWKATRITVGGREVTYLTEGEIHKFRARYARQGTTVEFFYPMELDVPSFSSVRLFDREPYNRRVELFTVAELLGLFSNDRLADGAEAIVREHFLPGAIQA